jgi:nitrate reductase NapE component
MRKRHHVSTGFVFNKFCNGSLVTLNAVCPITAKFVPSYFCVWIFKILYGFPLLPA